MTDESPWEAFFRRAKAVLALDRYDRELKVQELKRGSRRWLPAPQEEVTGEQQ